MAQIGRTFYCRKCDYAHAVTQPGEIPPCPACGDSVWRTGDQPKRPYRLSENDRRFLRKRLHIDPEV